MMAIFVATLMILSALVIALPAMQGREYGMNPAATSSANIQPNPILNTNVTWSTFYSGWNPLEYSNGSANLTLNAEESTTYENPITVNPTDIQNTGFPQKLGTSNENWTSAAIAGGGSTGQPTHSTKETFVQIASNTTAVIYSRILWNVSSAYLPSANPAFDYVNIIAKITQTGTGTPGATIFTVANNTSQACAGPRAENTNDSFTTTSNPTQATGFFFFSMNAAKFVKNFDTGYMLIGMDMSLPTTTTAGAMVLNETVYDLSITSQPMSLGTYTNATGIHPVTALTSEQDTLSTFSPSFAYTEITDNGYSAAISQPMQNLTTQQSAINSGSYIEQVEYQGQFNLPIAPDLSYGSANLTEHFNVSTSQTQVLDINGVSYLSTISGKNNTVLLLSSVNPNSQTQ